MANERVIGLLGVERWLRESRIAAARILPDLLDLPGSAMRRELGLRPELRPGVLQILLPLLREARTTDPQRVHELTAVLVANPVGGIPVSWTATADSLNGQAWTAHAAVLCTLGHAADARDAIGAALDLFRRDPQSACSLATAEVVEAEILHALGDRAPALRKIRRAAPVLLQHRERQRYAETRMTEAWMLFDAGNAAAAAEVWRTVANEAEERADRVTIGHVSNLIGVFELRRGHIDAASRCFANASSAFRREGLQRDVAIAERNGAETEVARGDYGRALFTFFEARRIFLAEGDIFNAAVASADILEMLFLDGQGNELETFAGGIVEPFSLRTMRPNALRAWTFVLERARSGELTRDDVADVRAYFRRLPLRPNAPFVPSEPPW